MKRRLVSIALLTCLSPLVLAQAISVGQFVTTYPDAGCTASETSCTLSSANMEDQSDNLWNGLVGGSNKLALGVMEVHNLETVAISDLSISGGGSTWVYPAGCNIFNVISSLACFYIVGDSAATSLTATYSSEGTANVKFGIVELTCTGGSWSFIPGMIGTADVPAQGTNNGYTLGLTSTDAIAELQAFVGTGSENPPLSPYDATEQYITNDHFVDSICFPSAGICDPPPTGMYTTPLTEYQIGAELAAAFKCVGDASPGEVR